MTDAVLIGIDVGTTSVKAVMLSVTGQRLAEFAASYPTRRIPPDRVEQDPQDWLRLVTAALTGFADRPEAARVRAICLTSQVNTHVFVDGAVNVLYPAIVWQDGRAAAAGARLDAKVSAAQKTEWLGAPIPLDASHALSRMAWIKATHPEVWKATAQVMLPRDFLIARLTGAVVADPISSVGLVTPALGYATGLIALLPGARQRLAPLRDPLSVAGHIREGQPFAGVPVITGMMDAWASLLGLGVASEGQAMYLSGTSEVLGLISATITGEPGVITFPPWAGITLHAGPTQAGGASLDWVARLLGQDPAALAAHAAPITRHSPLFLPHLQGERAPLWDATARGTFAGLTSATGPAELTAAVMEGVAFSARLAMEALQRSAGVIPAQIQTGGGGAASDRWCQMRANVFGRTFLRVEGRDPGALGAAVMAGVGVGLLPNLAQAAALMIRTDRVFEPDMQAKALADDRFALWQRLYAQIRPINEALA
ncbi:FGGY family carbohydrate kinase [Tabrizicola sp.]|uniref:xylulokinase n=1 Tax=Tabrizicola sp. TaxID=2005166 RepID=UPI00286B59FE|nr:FGGY family carbohydrate kinase [Tabrizicola sp.]